MAERALAFRIGGAVLRVRDMELFRALPLFRAGAEKGTRGRVRSPFRRGDGVKASHAGATLTEFLVGLGIAVLLGTVLVGLSVFTGSSFAFTGHLVDLDQSSRLALDTMSREIRQADRVLSGGLGSSGAGEVSALAQISFQSGTNTFSYSHSPKQRTLTRFWNGQPQVLLRDCDYARFDLFQRNATNGTYDNYPAAGTNTGKVVQLTWQCSRRLLGRQVTASHQSARVVIRKQP